MDTRTLATLETVRAGSATHGVPIAPMRRPDLTERARRELRAAYAELSLQVHAVKVRRQCTGTFGRTVDYLSAEDRAWQTSLATPGHNRRSRKGSGRARMPASESSSISMYLDQYLQASALVRLLPDTAWTCILEQFWHTADMLERACLAAGPLEDLLVIHGPAFIAKVELRAAVGDEFNDMLQAIWRSGMNPAVWQRLQRSLGQDR